MEVSSKGGNRKGEGGSVEVERGGGGSVEVSRKGGDGNVEV